MADVVGSVSIVIPTFRREVMLLEPIESALAQGDVVGEVIVADATPEASAEPFVDAAKDPRVRFLHLPPCGGMVGQVRNAGASGAKGPFILFLDDDLTTSSSPVRSSRWQERSRIGRTWASPSDGSRRLDREFGSLEFWALKMLARLTPRSA